MQDAQRADNPVERSRTRTVRHGSRPSQAQRATPSPPAYIKAFSANQP